MTWRKALWWLLVGLPILFILLSWVVLAVGGGMSPLPFGGILGLLIFSWMMPSGAVRGLCAVACFLLYGLLFLSLFFVRRGKRWAAGLVSFVLCVDIAVSVIVTTASWWFLLGIILDVGLILLLWRATVRGTE